MLLFFIHLIYVIENVKFTTITAFTNLYFDTDAARHNM